MNHPDFRVRRKIFATLWPDGKTGVVMLTPEQQRSVCDLDPSVFAPVKGGWGDRGATMVQPSEANQAHARKVLRMAWTNVAPELLHKALD